MRSLNKAMIIGNLGRKPEVRHTPSGDQVANFSVATSSRWKDSAGEWQEQTEWHDVVAWRRLAEVAEQYLDKGSRVFVEGRLQTRSWDGNDGNKRYRTEIVANQMIMLDSREDRGETRPAEDGFNPTNISDDDIPF